MLKRLVRQTEVLTLLLPSLAIFLPIIGHGFVHDDFLWLADAAFKSWRSALTDAGPGGFFCPLVSLEFKLEWFLWGFHAFPYAALSLTLHIANIFLVASLARKLWGRMAGLWAGFGFSLLYISNAWAVMWISTLPHVMATLLSLVALHAAVHYGNRKNPKIWHSSILALFALMPLAAKEVGITVPIAVFLTFLYQRIRLKHGLFAISDIAFAIIVLLAIPAYFYGRANAGAIGIGSAHGWYRFSAEPRIVLSNIWAYLNRTYNILAALGVSLAIARRKGFELFLNEKQCGGESEEYKRMEPDTIISLIFSFSLFALTLAPTVALQNRSGIYTYLPGIGASLSLGALIPYIRKKVTPQPIHRFGKLAWIPAAIVVVALVAATEVQAKRWLIMAQTSTAILKDIQAQLPANEGELVLLEYSTRDSENRFPDCFSTYGFGPALRLLYGNTAVWGEIVQRESQGPVSGSQPIRFEYVASDGHPHAFR